jgi:uncharacterized RDD family membrane protein YckC
MTWFYATKEKTQAGPVDDAALDALYQSGSITADTLIWKEGMAEWQPFAAVRPLPTALTPAALAVPASPATPLRDDQAVCAETGQVFNKSDMVQIGGAWVGAAAKPAYLQKMSEGIEPTTGMRYAGFWIRFLAKFIDGLILTVVLVVPFLIFMALTGAFGDPESSSAAATLAQIVFQIGYYVVAAGYSIFFTGKYGATPGKMACKLLVVDPSGGKISYARATGRYFAEILSGLICYIGYIMVAFDSEKRGLHDRLCNTRVIYK